MSSDTTIRLMKPEDEKEIAEFLWSRTFHMSWMEMAMNIISSHLTIALSFGFAVITFWQQHSVLWSIFAALSLPVSIYLYVRFVVIPLEYIARGEFREGIFKCWSKNELGRYLWVAVKNGTVVGCGGLSCISATTGAVGRVAVKEKHTRQGIAGKLMDVILKKCESRGYDHVILETSYIQIAAQKLYEGLGFRRVNESFLGAPKWKIFPVSIYLYHLSLQRNGNNASIWAESKAFDMM